MRDVLAERLCAVLSERIECKRSGHQGSEEKSKLYHGVDEYRGGGVVEPHADEAICQRAIHSGR